MLIKLSIPILFLFYLSAKADSLDRIRYDIVDQSANSTLRREFLFFFDFENLLIFVDKYE